MAAQRLDPVVQIVQGDEEDVGTGERRERVVGLTPSYGTGEGGRPGGLNELPAMKLRRV